MILIYLSRVASEERSNVRKAYTSTPNLTTPLFTFQEQFDRMGSIGAAGEGVHIPYRLDGKVALVTGSGRGKGPHPTGDRTDQSLILPNGA